MSYQEKFEAMVSAAKGSIEDFNDFSDDRAIVWAAAKIQEQSELLMRIAVGLNSIIHSTNHCGDDATLFSDFAGQVSEELHADIEEVLGKNNAAIWTDQRDTALRTANEALAARVEQMREALKEILKWNKDLDRPVLDAYVRSILTTTDDTASTILAERDARTLRTAAEIRNSDDVLAPVGNSAYGEAYQEGWIAGTEAFYAALVAMADELAKAGATDKQS